MNNIYYTIQYGTLLGAVRHWDMIPWDDDADLVVLNATPAQIFNALHDEMIKDSQYRFHLLLVSAL